MRSQSLLRALLSIAIAFLFATSVAAQVARPDFTGRWTLQETSVSGGGRGDASGLLYLSSDSTLVLETDVTGSLGGRKAVYRKAG